METIHANTKHFMKSLLKNSPISLELLNQGVLICLAAYVTRTNEITQDFSYLKRDIHLDRDIFIRDLIYDIVNPNVPKALREAVDVISNGNINFDITEITIGLLNSEFEKEDIQRLVNDIALYYYPMVMTEAVSTPSSINNLCLSILNPTSGSFYDGTAGLCSTCIAASQYAKERNGHLSIYAQELLEVLCAVSTIRAYINEIDDIQILSGDVLLSPRFLDSSGRFIMQFDYSVMFPPLGLSRPDLGGIEYQDKFKRFNYSRWLPKSNTEWMFIEHLMASLNDSGRGIIAVSTGTLYNSANRHIRQHAIEEGYIECIITLPSKILSFTSIPLSLIVVNKGKKKNSAIMMIQAESLFSKNNSIRVVDQLDEQVIDEIVSIYQRKCKNQQAERLVEPQELLQNDCILLPSRYICTSSVESDIGRVVVDFETLTKLPVLKTVSEKIYRGLNISQAAKEQADGNYKIINYADIQNGEINKTELKTYQVKKVDIKKYLVQPGDVLVSCKGATIKTCVVDDDVKDTLLSINFVGIRLNREKCDPYYLKYYLDSPAGQAFLKSRQVGTSIITLKNTDFEELPIALPPLEEQQYFISEYEKVQRRICDEMRQLHRHLIQEKWRFYQRLGLDKIITKDEEE